jgi:AraC-like DNA-binding protein
MEPLSRYPFLRSADLEEAREVVARELKPHKLQFVGSAQPLDTIVNRVHFQDVQILYIRYGAHVLIEAEPLTDYLVVLPVAGMGRFTVVDDDGIGNPDQAIVVSPGSMLRVDWDEDCAVINVSVARRALEDYAARLAGFPVREPLRFEPFMPVAEGPGRSWRLLIDFLGAELDDEHSVLSAGLQTRLVEEMVYSTLLNAQRHSLSNLMRQGRSLPSPYYVKRVEDYIRAHLEHPFTIDDLTAVAKVSVRTIYDGFRKYRGMGPMKYAKMLRLDRTREELAAADPETVTVKEIADKWGFHHGSSFAADYVGRFGELPSETLRRHMGVRREPA